MPEEHFDVMSYYENGTQDQQDKHERWVKLLDDMYDKKLNRIGMAKMYKVLQAANPEPGAYPTKRFIKDYLSRQHDNQIRKQGHSNRQDVISSVITQRPNQIIMVDYLYFYWESNDLRGKGPIDSDGKDDKTKQSQKNETEVDKLFTKDLKGKYKNEDDIRGVIVAIDVFSKYGYVEKIVGNINSAKAWEAMDNILKDANNKFGKEFGPVRIIQTDKGSEFMNSNKKLKKFNGFKENLIKISEYQKEKHTQIQLRDGVRADKYKDYGLTQEKMYELKGKPLTYYLKHYYGYEGRSTAQSMVERLNRTLKTMTMRALNNKVVPGWSDLIATSRDPNTGVATKVGQILKNYNSNYHSSIKTSPEKVVKMKKNDKEIKEIAQHIKDRAIRHGDIDQGAYKVGDFVRIKIFKPTKLGPKYTFKGGLAKILKRSKDVVNFDGVFVIHSVQKGSNSDQGSRQTTYRIVSNWSHESKVGSLPSGQTKARAGKQIVIKSRKVIELRSDNSNLYPKAAYGRNFTKSALSRVPTTDKGLPDSQRKSTYSVEAIVSEEQVDGETMYEVQWKDENEKTYDENTYEPIENLKGDHVFEKYQKDK